jgi:hypothetical protein
MNELLEMNLIGRIQALLINLHRKDREARSQMLWLLLGLIEAALRVGHLTAAEHAEYERMACEMLCFSEGQA